MSEPAHPTLADEQPVPALNRAERSPAAPLLELRLPSGDPGEIDRRTPNRWIRS